MDTNAKRQYMETLRKRYLKSNKKAKGEVLDEYCRNTGENRKYAIKKFRYKIRLKANRKKKKEYYDGYVKAALAAMWKVFDYPCGQRLETILKEETDRMRRLNELSCSDEVADKLKKIASATIDRKLEHEREVELNKRKYKPSFTFPLKNEVPVKTSAELDRKNPGTVQIDFVEHCGVSASGEYVNSLSVVDIYSGWWEGDAVSGKGQERALKAIDAARKRSPFDWKEMHPDNGGKIKKKYDKAKTPYKRFMESDGISPERKEELKAIYESLNPALLKRNIEKKLNRLQNAYEKKKGLAGRSAPAKKIKSGLGVFFNHPAKTISVL